MDKQLMALGLTEHGGKVVVSSRDIARIFEKKHDSVIRDIKNIIRNNTEWGLLNFEESACINEQVHIQPANAMARASFTLLVMG